MVEVSKAGATVFFCYPRTSRNEDLAPENSVALEETGNQEHEGGKINSRRREEKSKMDNRASISEIPKWINNFNGKLTEENAVQKESNLSSDTDDLKSDVQSVPKSVRRRKKRSKSPRTVGKKEEFHVIGRKHEVKRPFSVTGRSNENDCRSKDKSNKKSESCALEEKYIREFIEREIRKQQNSLKGFAGEGAIPEEEEKMNDVKGNFKRIDEDEIHTYGNNHLDAFQFKASKKCDGVPGRISRRSDAFLRREKSNGFFSFLKWFKRSKEMPELEGAKDSSVTSSPLFVRRRSSSCGSVDTLFSIATANSFAFVSPVQYQAVISSSHTAYPVPDDNQKADEELKCKNQSDYENSPLQVNNEDKPDEDVKVEGQSGTEKRKKFRAPDPPGVVRDVSLPSTLEHKKPNEDDDTDTKSCHRRTVSESFKDKKAGYYCHVQGKRKAPLPPSTAPLYPSLSSLKNQCPSISKKKRPAPPPPTEGKDIYDANKPKESTAESSKSSDESRPTTSNYDNMPFLSSKDNETTKNNISAPTEKEVLKPNGINLSPLLGFISDSSGSPLPSRPWYKRNSSGSNILKKESVKFGDRKKNKENEEWMPEVGFSRRPISNEGGHNIFSLLTRLDKGLEKKKEDKRKSQISILANISELDREAAEIVRKEHAQEKKMMADKDEKYYSSYYDNNVLASFPNILRNTSEPVSDGKSAPKKEEKNEKPLESPKQVMKNPFDEFKSKADLDKAKQPKINCKSPSKDISEGKKSDTQAGAEEPVEEKKVEGNVKYDANAELDYYINPWNCPTCTLVNPGWEKFCEACNTMRVKFRSALGNVKKEPEISEKPVEKAEKKPETKEAEKEERKPKIYSPLLRKSKSEETPSKTDAGEAEDPSEDNLEGVRRKRLAFFTSKQSSLRDSAAMSSLDEAEKLKLKIMLKEMKDSLPKREKGVINNAADPTTKEDAAEVKNAPQETILHCPGKSSGDADAKTSTKEFSNTKVQQTWQPVASDPNKYGAIKKVRQLDPPSTTAEAIVVTKTTVYEDIIVRKSDKGQKVSTSVQTKSSVKGERASNESKKDLSDGEETEKERRTVESAKDIENHAYANVQNIKEKAGVYDLSVTENTVTNGDIETVTARLQEDGAGSADYQVDIRPTSSSVGMNTLHVNKLLGKLETAINSGQHLEAANIAKELAKMKVSCSVKRQKAGTDASLSKIIIDLYVEDKVTHKGPIRILIQPTITLGQLKTKVEKEWNIPCTVQRWILGKQLATDDSKTLEQHGVTNNSCPVFLYLVAAEQTGEQRETVETCAKNLPEPTKPERRNGRVSAMYAEARRPSLIIEEESESACEETENGPETDRIDKAKAEEENSEAAKKPSNPAEGEKTETPSAKRKEFFPRRNSPSSFNFEKREMNEHLKKELKAITATSVRERIERLNRAATGGATETTEQAGWKGKIDNRTDANKPKRHYNELMQLENADLVTNAEEFECPICLVDYSPGEGVVLKDCLHTFCRPCLVNTVQFNEEAEVKCPYRDDNYSCQSVLQEREIKSLVPKGLFEQHLAKSVSVAENNIGNAYHCKTPDCKGWCILEDNINEFRCPVCKVTNCLTCQSVHAGMNCRQYQEQIQFASDTNVEAKKTRDMLQEMVEKGEAMACPTCQVVLMKKWGCDWLRCSMCKTEICWVTRGPRWGPGGKGDTSAGCQCGVNGVKCHPKCNYCH